ncbi:hypothetical protein WG915_10260 [Corynebacterium sp. H128]|uniref:hypothetical protein n=1 Tax=Corynebacterium sp. H128 TaxID=3133427 RepID=UPI00309C833A
MRRTPLSVLVLASTLALASCSANDAASPSGADSTAAGQAGNESTAASPTPGAQLADAYEKVLDNPDAYQFNKTDPFQPAGTYSYALAEATGDDSPELLIRADVTDYFAPVSVFTKPEQGEVVNTQDVLISGVASAGGSRSAVMVSASGQGLYQSVWHSLRPNTTLQQFVVADRKLTKTGDETEIPLKLLPDPEHREVKWIPASDRSALAELRGGTGVVSQQASAPTPQGEAGENCGTVGAVNVHAGTAATSCGFSKAVASAVAASPERTGAFSVQATSPSNGQNYSMNCTAAEGRISCTGGNNALVVLTPATADQVAASSYEYALEGTVVAKSTAEVLNGKTPPNNESPNNEYLMLMFDAPQEITGTKSGSPGKSTTQSATYLALGDHEESPYGTPEDTTGPWRPYVGKRVRLSINSDSMWYQSDASLPLGGPRIAPTGNYSIEEL